jgi:hypothetical protein
LWQRERRDELEVPDLTTRDNDPVYLSELILEEKVIDKELNKFCEYKRLESKLPIIYRLRIQDLETSRTIRACYGYCRQTGWKMRGVHKYLTPLLVYPLIYVKIFELEVIQSEELRPQIEKIIEKVERDQIEEEQLDHFTEEVIGLNGFNDQQIIDQMNEIVVRDSNLIHKFYST